MYLILYCSGSKYNIYSLNLKSRFFFAFAFCIVVEANIIYFELKVNLISGNEPDVGEKEHKISMVAKR